MNYIKHFTFYTALLIATIGAFNWFIDPYGMYWSPMFQGINERKTSASNRIRITKPYRVTQLKPQILIMGNSRVELGIDPNNELFANKTTYNLSLAGATFHSQIDHIYHAMHENKNLETILFGLDFFDFLVTETGNETDNTPTSYGHRVYSAQGWPAYKKKQIELFSLIFSLDGLKSSVQTIFLQSSFADNITALGFNDAQSYVNLTKTEGKVPLFSQKLAFVEDKLTQQAWRLESKEGSPISPKFEKLAQLIKQAHKRNIELKLFINPYHYTYLQKINDLGHFELYLDWKKKLSTFMGMKENRHISVIDFSGFNHFTTSAPQLNEPFKPMQWYWEPAHYKRELGDEMLKRLYTEENIRFGIELSNTSIDNILEKERQDLARTQEQWLDVVTYF